MGISILEMVVRHLREKNFPADIAYPGQKFPQITKVVAAVHIASVNRKQTAVTLEVNVLCPGAMGGGRCELEALRATEILRNLGADCFQDGCRYDGAAQVYVVPIRASFTAVTEAKSHSIGPGYYVYINEVHHEYVQSFLAEEKKPVELVFSVDAAQPAAAVPQGSRWEIQLEERIPVGGKEHPEPSGDFSLKVVVGDRGEIYFGCNWQTVRREYTPLGLLRIRKGTAAGRKDVVLP